VIGSTNRMQPRSASTPFEDQFQDALQQLVDVERVAHGQRGAIHHLQIASRPGQPRVLRHVGLEVEDAAAFFLRH